MIYQWNIFWAVLNPAVDSEQAGVRLVLVVSAEHINQVLNVVTIVPLTVRKPGRRVYPTEALLSAADTDLPRDSIAMAQQVKTVAKRRLGEQCGGIGGDAAREAVRRALRVHLDLEG